jgi:moderate conductance mechanosensitive channel
MTSFKFRLSQFVAAILLSVVMVAPKVGFAVETAAQPQQAAPAPSENSAEIVRVLEDPVAREQLIKDLANPATTAASPASPTSAALASNNQTSKALLRLSKSINAIQFGLAEIINEIHRGEKVYSSFANQFTDSKTRKAWLLLLLKCAVVLALSYVVFFYSRYATDKFRVWFLRVAKKWFKIKIFNLLFLVVIDLLPIAVFAMVGYFTLILLNLEEHAQWILLAWISAFIIVKVIAVIIDFLLGIARLFPRLLTLSDKLTGFLKTWLRRLTALIVYGYFFLQIALYLGALPNIYGVLLKFWGFLIVLTLITFILSIPLRVIKLLETRKGRIDQKTLQLERLARIELTVRAAVIIYLLVLYTVWIVREDNFFWFVVRGTVLSAILLFFANRMAQIIRNFLSRDFSVSRSLKKRLPGLEYRFRRYRKILDIVLRTFIYVFLALILIKIWSGKEVIWLPPIIKELLLIKIITIVCIFLGATLLWEVSNSLVEFSLTKGGEDLTIESGRAHTLLTVARKTIFVTLSLIAFLMILSEFGINIGPLLAGAGVLGLAISFGAKQLMQDIITGFFMLLENQIAVGDYVKIAEKSGTVEVISIRTVRLRDSDGVVHIIPYSSIVAVSNFTKEFSCYLFEISVAYRENIDDVITVLRQIARNLQLDPDYGQAILEPLEVMGLDKFADSAVVIRARFKTRPGMQWIVGREFNRRMKQKFDELDIQMPFPHRVIFFGENKDGSSPAARLQVKLEETPPPF